jgi:hypothetical protein
LQRTCDAAVERRIGRWITITGRQLLLGIDRRGSRLAVCHASTIKDVFRVLSLCEEEAGVITTYLDAEEKPQGAEVFDGKLSMEFFDDALQQLCVRRRQDDVVDVDEEVGHGVAASVDEQ